MKVRFVGTGNAFASGGRNAMAILLRAPGLGVLLDCGPTTLTALKRGALSPEDVDLILLSHHHGDHFAGVPFLLLHEIHVGARRKDLVVAGPAGTSTLLSRTMDLMYPGTRPEGFALTCFDLEPDEPFTTAAASVDPFEVDHFSRGTALGYRVQLEGKTVVFSGDTAWTDALVERAAGADLLICECSSFETKVKGHLSHRELASHRDRFQAKRTLLVHAGDDVLERRDELLFELAYDGMEVTL